MSEAAFDNFDFTKPSPAGEQVEPDDAFSGFDFSAPAPEESVSQLPANLQGVLPEDDVEIQSMLNPASGIQQGAEMKLGGGFLRAGQGVKQLTLDVLEEFGFLDEGTTEAYTKMTENDRAFVNQKFQEEFGDRGIFTVADVAGQAAPFAALPAGGSTAAARTVLGAMSGATAGAATFEGEGESRVFNTALGGALGGIIAPLLETVPAVKGFFQRFIGLPGKGKTPLEAEALGPRREFIEEGLKITDDTGVEFKLSQLTGDPATESAEQLARAGVKGERMAREKEGKQVVQLLKFYKRALTKLERKPSIVGGQRKEFGERVIEVFDRTMGDPKSGKGLFGARAKNAKANFAAVDASMGKAGTIPVDNFRNQIRELAMQNSQRGSTKPQQRLVKELVDIYEDFKDGVMNPSELQNLLSTYGDAASGSGRMFSDQVDNAKDLAVGKSLFGSLLEDIDAAVKVGAPGASDLKIARDAYLRDTAAINEVRNTALGRLFNKNVESTPASIKDALLKMKAPDIKAAMNILTKTEPGMARGAQRLYLEDFIEKARVVDSADIIGFSPDKMLNLVKDKERFKAMFPDVKSRMLVMRGVEAARRIMINNSRTGGRGFPRAKELAGVIASRDKTFIARLGADLLAPDVMAKSLLTDEGVKGLTLIAEPYNQNKWSAGLVAISNGLRNYFDEQNPPEEQ